MRQRISTVDVPVGAISSLARLGTLRPRLSDPRKNIEAPDQGQIPLDKRSPGREEDEAGPMGRDQRRHGHPSQKKEKAGREPKNSHQTRPSGGGAVADINRRKKAGIQSKIKDPPTMPKTTIGLILDRQTSSSPPPNLSADSRQEATRRRIETTGDSDKSMEAQARNGSLRRSGKDETEEPMADRRMSGMRRDGDSATRMEVQGKRRRLVQGNHESP